MAPWNLGVHGDCTSEYVVISGMFSDLLCNNGCDRRVGALGPAVLQMHHCGPRLCLAAAVVALLMASAVVHARFEWRDVVQQVQVLSDGSVVVFDERTLWTDEDYIEAFVCLPIDERRLTVLPESGAVSEGPPAEAFSQSCEGGTEIVVRQDERVSERRVRFAYRIADAVILHGDVAQLQLRTILPSRPPVVGFDLVIEAPGPMEHPYNAFLERLETRYLPRVTFSPDRSRLEVSYDHVPSDALVEVTWLMDPLLFDRTGEGNALDQLLDDNLLAVTIVASLAADPGVPIESGDDRVEVFVDVLRIDPDGRVAEGDVVDGAFLDLLYTVRNRTSATIPGNIRLNLETPEATEYVPGRSRLVEGVDLRFSADGEVFFAEDSGLVRNVGVTYGQVLEPDSTFSFAYTLRVRSAEQFNDPDAYFLANVRGLVEYAFELVGAVPYECEQAIGYESFCATMPDSEAAFKLKWDTFIAFAEGEGRDVPRAASPWLSESVGEVRGYRWHDRIVFVVYSGGNLRVLSEVKH